MTKGRRHVMVDESALRTDDSESGSLYEAALGVQQDQRLAAEMAEWDVTAADGASALL